MRVWVRTVPKQGYIQVYMELYTDVQGGARPLPRAATEHTEKRNKSQVCTTLRRIRGGGDAHPPQAPDEASEPGPNPKPAQPKEARDTKKGGEGATGQANRSEGRGPKEQGPPMAQSAAGKTGHSPYVESWRAVGAARERQRLWSGARRKPRLKSWQALTRHLWPLLPIRLQWPPSP